MDTKLKSIKASAVFKTIIVVLFFAVCVIIGVVTGFAGAYGYMADDYSGIEALLVDSPADTDMIWGMSFSNMETINARFSVCNTSSSKTSAVNSCDFYVRVEYSDGTVFSNEKDYVAQTICSQTVWGEEAMQYIEYTVALTPDQYNGFCYSWNQMKGNMQIILVTDICLLIAAIVLGVLICSSAGVQHDGTSQLKPFFKTHYEIILMLITGLLILSAITAICEFDLDYVAQLGAGGKMFVWRFAAQLAADWGCRYCTYLYVVRFVQDAALF